MADVTPPTSTQFAVAVHVLSLLAGARDGPRSSEQMAVSVGASPVYMRRVLGRLRIAGIVESRPGPRGGWRLRRDPGSVHLGEVWRAVNDDERVLTLHGPNPECPIGRRVQQALTALDRRASAALIAELDRTTITELAVDGQDGQADIVAPRRADNEAS